MKRDRGEIQYYATLEIAAVEWKSKFTLGISRDSLKKLTGGTGIKYEVNFARNEMRQKISQHEFPKVREKESVFNKSLLHFFDFSHHQHWKFEKQKHDRLLSRPPLF